MYNIYILQYIIYVFHTPRNHIMLDSLSKPLVFLKPTPQSFNIAAHFTEPRLLGPDPTCEISTGIYR